MKVFLKTLMLLSISSISAHFTCPLVDVLDFFFLNKSNDTSVYNAQNNGLELQYGVISLWTKLQTSDVYIMYTLDIFCSLSYWIKVL